MHFLEIALEVRHDRPRVVTCGRLGSRRDLVKERFIPLRYRLDDRDDIP